MVRVSVLADALQSMGAYCVARARVKVESELGKEEKGEGTRAAAMSRFPAQSLTLSQR